MTDADADTQGLDWLAERKAAEVLATIALAEYRCLPTRELVSRLTPVWRIGDSEALLRQLRERTRETEDVRMLLETAVAWSSELEAARPVEQRILLKAIRQIVKLLPPAEAAEVADRFITHRLKLGRDISYEAYKHGSLPARNVSLVLNQYMESGDQRLLELLARQPPSIIAPVVETLLETLEEPYWRGRAMAALLETTPEKAREVSPRFPREYAHAVGRLRAVSELSQLVLLFERNRRDFDFLGLYAYALGRLSRLSELLELRQHVKRLLAGRPREASAQQAASPDVGLAPSGRSGRRR